MHTVRMSSLPHTEADAVARLAEAVAVMGSLADDAVRRWWPDLPDEVVAVLEEIGRCRSAALRELPAVVHVEAGEPDCPDGVEGTVLRTSLPLPDTGREDLAS